LPASNLKQPASIIPAGEARCELIIDKSRVIACAAPAFSVEQARVFITKIHQEYPDASHHVPIFIIGQGASVTMHCSDDGEPSGTAGRPALAVLQGSGLGDVVVVITRYFGGIKLGTGGLVRAYSDAVREVLAKLPRAEKVATTLLMISIDYTYLERVRLLVAEYAGTVNEEEYTAEVTLTLRFRDEQLDGFLSRLKDMTRGNTNVIIVDRQPDTIMPFSSTGGNY
jgi:uncharacterized YigZ family protein